MGTDPPSWACWQNLPWQYGNLNYGCNASLQDLAPPNAHLALCPSYADRVAIGSAGRNVPTAVGVPGVLQRSSAFRPPLDVMNAPSEAAAERRFLIFDQSGDGTSLLFSSVGPPIWNLEQRSQKPKPSSKFGLEAMLENYVPVNASNGMDDGDGSDEMHEDTDEIDALLYSDSEFEDADGEECEEFMGPSIASAEEVASNSVPTKRRRLNKEAIDMSLVDTASSERARKPCIQYGEDAGDDSSCFGSPTRGVTEGQEQPPQAGSGKGLKRARIQETLCMLRKIIPGGKGKDDTAVLDEAIRYLRSLRLKAKPK